jgi:hypothetical protein
MPVVLMLAMLSRDSRLMRGKGKFTADQNVPALQTGNQAVVVKDCQRLNATPRIETVRD